MSDNTGGSLGNADEVISAANQLVNSLDGVAKMTLAFNLAVAMQNARNIYASLGDHIIALQVLGVPTDKHVNAGKAAEEAVVLLDTANELAKEAANTISQAKECIAKIPGLLANGSQGYLLNDSPVENKPAPPRHLRSVHSEKKEDDA